MMKPQLVTFGWATAAILLPGAASAASWVPIADGIEGTRVFVDTDSVVHMDPIKKFWLKFDYSAVKTSKVRESLSLNKVNCISRSYWVVQRTVYSASGAVVRSEDKTAYAERYVEIVPDSIMDGVTAIICSVPASGERR